MVVALFNILVVEKEEVYKMPAFIKNAEGHL